MIRGDRPAFSEADADEVSAALLDRVCSEGRLEELDRLRSLLKHGAKEWHERPFLDGFPKADDYVNGNIGLAIKFNDLSGVECDPYHVHWLARYHLHVIEDPVLNPSSVGAKCKIDDPGSTQRGDQEVMFVPIVQLPGKPQQVIATLIGLQRIENEGVGPLNGLLYRSLVQGSYHFLPRCASRQGGFRRVGAHTSPESHPTIVEGGPHVVNGVTSQETDNGWQRFGRLHDQGPFAGLRVRFGYDGARVFLDDAVSDAIQISDVMLGPLDLDPSVAKRKVGFRVGHE